jgi:NAD(P)-dependent dehydrogenase (short-subunit alcohol dehydrogenase family)
LTFVCIEHPNVSGRVFRREKFMGILDGKVAIITGATSGIGEKVAEVFVEQGATVIATARREKEGAILQQRLGLTFLRCDVSRDEDVAALFDQAPRRFGKVDCLVNNAGSTAPVTPLAELDMATFDRVMSVNIRGLVMCMKRAAAAMLPREQGSIINVASVAGSRGGFTGYPYSASKGAVLAVTRSAATELGEKGIRVNAISPGGIVTGIFGKNAGLEGAAADKATDAVREIFGRLQPIPRAGETIDIANAAAFLASDGASFINGHDFVIDGGLTANVVSWTGGLALRAELGTAIKAAVATD